MNSIKPPPLLLGAALLFWGWQSGYTTVGLILGLIIELPRWSKTRWELSEEDFSRIWMFCSLLLLAGVVYAFTLNEGPMRFAQVLQDPDLRNQTRAGVSSARTAAALTRWVPIIFFLFVAAQQYSAREGIPLQTVSLILRRRWKKAKREGKTVPPTTYVDISYIYFILCLFSASIHGEESRGFFWGAGVLVMWALWPFRSRRFHVAIWAGCMAVTFALAFAGQRGLTEMQQYFENLNPQWLSSFQRGRFDANLSKTSLGQIGRMHLSRAIVIRIQRKDGPVPEYLREASYNTYRRTTWNTPDVERDFERVDEEYPTTFNLLPGKTNLAQLQISCFLPNRKDLLPLPAGTGCLTNLPAFIVQKNAFGAVLAEGPGLVIFDALFGPGPVIDTPPSITDLGGPQEYDEPALDKVIEDLSLRGKPKQVVMDTLSRYFASSFTYSTWQPRPRAYWHERRREGRTNSTPVARFLLQSHSGHCEYFATATVLLLQRLGFPARYAVGYRVHEIADPEESQYVVRQRDAHAWCLVWDEDRGIWRDFDTTPGSALPSEGPLTWREKLSDTWSRVVYEFLRIRWGQTRMREYILWVVIPILVILLGQIIFSRRKRAGSGAKRARDSITWPGLDSEFYELEKRLGRRGLVRQPGEPLALWLERGRQSLPALQAAGNSLRELLRLHYRYRFDPKGITPGDRNLLAEYARQLIARAKER